MSNRLDWKQYEKTELLAKIAEALFDIRDELKRMNCEKVPINLDEEIERRLRQSPVIRNS